MDSPFFTIVIPTRDAGSMLHRALESIQLQTFGSYEVFVIDAKSTDGTVGILQSYEKRFPQLRWISEEDNGIYDAMNKGIQRARGEWLYFMGSDDTLLDENVLLEVAAFVVNKKCSMVYGNVQLKRPIGYHFNGLVYAGAFDSEKLLKRNICHQAIFYNRTLFDRFGFYRTKYKIFADYDFNLRCFCKARPLYFDRIIANFHLEGRSTSQQSADTLFQEQFLENMTLNYGYSYDDPFFAGRKRELFRLLRKKVRGFKPKAAFRTARILAYQYLLSKQQRNTNNIPNSESVNPTNL